MFRQIVIETNIKLQPRGTLYSSYLRTWACRRWMYACVCVWNTIHIYCYCGDRYSFSGILYMVYVYVNLWIIEFPKRKSCRFVFFSSSGAHFFLHISLGFLLLLCFLYMEFFAAQIGPIFAIFHSDWLSNSHETSNRTIYEMINWMCSSFAHMDIGCFSQLDGQKNECVGPQMKAINRNEKKAAKRERTNQFLQQYETLLFLL